MKQDMMKGKNGRVHRVLVPWLSGGLTMHDLQQAKVAYLQCAVDFMTHKSMLEPNSLLLHVTKFKDRRLRPLKMHIVQIVRFMLLSGEYALGSRWPVCAHLYLIVTAVLDHHKRCRYIVRYHDACSHLPCTPSTTASALSDATSLTVHLCAGGRRYDILVANAISTLQDAVMDGLNVDVRLVYFCLSGKPAPADGPT